MESENELLEQYGDDIDQEAQKIGIFVAWPYANGPRHLGHAASLLPADILARYYREIGADVLMVSGTDEYGTPNMIAAEKANMPTSEYVDDTNQIIREDFISMGMTYDWFTRTTSPVHHENVQNTFRILKENGFIQKMSMLGSFDAETGKALPDRYVEGGCPKCGAGARGDQCENCSALLDPQDLIDPRSSITNNEVEFKETDHYFLMLDMLADEISDFIDNNQNLRVEAKAMSRNMADDLPARPISRDMNWGIPIPEEYTLGDGKVLYVWFEAVNGYMSAAIEWARSTGDPERWREWWQNPNSTHYYAMGKDNVPFHTIVWPGIIAALNKSAEVDKKFKQPDYIASTGYMNFNESKFSSSRGNVVYIRDLLEVIGPDSLRYYFISSGPENKDTNFSYDEVLRRHNDELLAKWGNLVSRSMALIGKNHDNAIPESHLMDAEIENHPVFTELQEAFSEVASLIEEVKFGLAIRRAMQSVKSINQFIYNSEPWKTIKTDRESAERDMFIVINAVYNLNVLLSPFIPHASKEVANRFVGNELEFGEPIKFKTDYGIDIITGDYSQSTGIWGMKVLLPGSEIEGGKMHLFKKIKDVEELKSQVEKVQTKRKIGLLALK